MDIVNPTFRRYAEKIIRTLMAHVQHHPAIIGWQLDNETKHYDNIGRYMQEGFVRSLGKYPDLRQLNHDFGLDYWSNRIDRWQDFPPVENTINASLACAFSRYQRQQVTEYLAWQAEIVREYAQPHQFVTHNFDFEWRGYLRRAAAGRPFCGGAGAGYRRRRYLSPEPGTPDRAGNRLWRRHHPLA
jgi:beta-galactosidase